MTWEPSKPYNDLPSLPPSVDLETRRVLKATVEARAALARCDARAQSLPNPTVLINAIPLLEAQASSEIENIVTTTDELFSAAATDSAATPAAREALRYRSALYAGWQDIGKRPITATTALQICEEIRGHNEGVRVGEVYIGDPITRRRIYTPPDRREIILRLLNNWEDFVNDPSDIDPIVRMAVAHYQFEAIHPFTDGNGRTGRILNVLMLCDAGLLQFPLLYLSRYIISAKDEYYRLLRRVTSDEQWEDWITYIVNGVRDTALHTIEVIEGIGHAQEYLLDEVREVAGQANYDLLSVLMEQPYARSRDVVDRCAVSRQTASKWLHGLVNRGVLSSIRAGRETLFINEPLMSILRQ